METYQETKIVTTPKVKTKRLIRKDIELGFVAEILKKCLDGFDTLAHPINTSTKK